MARSKSDSAREFFSVPQPTGEQGPDGAKPEPIGKDGGLSVLIEMRSPGGNAAFAMSSMEAMTLPGVQFDQEFTPVPMTAGNGGEGMADTMDTVVVRAVVADDAQIDELRRQPNVVDVYKDTPIAPFAADASVKDRPAADTSQIPSMAPCPI